MPLPAGAYVREGMAFTADGALIVSNGGSGGTIDSPTFTGTVTASQVQGIERVLAQWGVPVILASSGTMGNNGAVSAMTALPTTYSGGAWLYLPANAIDGSSAAGFYWFVASSTTAGTVYNSTFAGAGVPAAGTATPFVTTGPGAFTGVAAGEIVCATVAVPAGGMGPNGALHVSAHGTCNTAAGNKIPRIRLGGIGGDIAFTVTLGTSAWTDVVATLRNLGSAALQTLDSKYGAGTTTTTVATVYGTQNSAGALDLVFTLNKAAATNHVLWGGATVKITYAP